MQHVCGHSGNLGNECADHAAALGAFGLAGSVITLTLLLVLMDVTTSARSWNDYSTFEQMQRPLTRTEFFDGHFSSGPPLLCILRDVWSCVSSALTLFPSVFLLLQTSDRQTLFTCVHRTEYRRLLRAKYVESSVGIAFLRASKWYRRLLSRGNRRSQDRTLLSLCS